MLNVNENPDLDPVPPECRATVARIQRALDRADGACEALDGDPHPAACAACRERVRAAHVLMSVLAAPPEPVPVPAGFADRVLAAVAADRQLEVRRADNRTRVRRVAAWMALAAAIVVGMFYLAAREHATPNAVVPGPVETAKPLDVAPAPREKVGPIPAPEQRPIRIGDEFAKAGHALLEAPKPLTESVAVAPRLLDALTDPFKNPVGAQPDPMATAIEPARKSIVDLPTAARSGLEPVTSTAEKAFDRFLHDVGAVKPKS